MEHSNDPFLEQIAATSSKTVENKRLSKRSLLANFDLLEEEENNDDEKEKEERENTSQNNKETKVETTPRFLTIMTAEEAETHFSICLKLNSQNKINMKNAFQLQVIDFIKTLLQGNSVKTDNLSYMAYALDAGTKIYSCRVDKIYEDMKKCLSGKITKIDTEQNDDMETAEDVVAKMNVTNFEESLMNVNQTLSLSLHEQTKSDEIIDENENNYWEQKFEKHITSKEAWSRQENKKFKPVNYTTSMPKNQEFYLECSLDINNDSLKLCKPVIEKVIMDTNNTSYKLSGLSNIKPLNDSNYKDNFEAKIKGYDQIKDVFYIVDENEKIAALDQSFTISDINTIQEYRELKIEDNPFDDVGWGNEELEDNPMNNTFVPSIRKSVTTNNSYKSVTIPLDMIGSRCDDYSYFDKNKLKFWKGPSFWKIKKVKYTKPVKSTNAIKKNDKKVQFNYESFLLAFSKAKLHSTIMRFKQKSMDSWNNNILPKYVCSNSKECFAYFNLPNEYGTIDKRIVEEVTENSTVKKNSQNKLVNLELEMDMFDDERNNSSYAEEDIQNISDHNNQSAKEMSDIFLGEKVLNEMEDMDCELVSLPTSLLTVKHDDIKTSRNKKIDIKSLKKHLWDLICEEAEKSQFIKPPLTEIVDQLQNLNCPVKKKRLENGKISFQRLFKQIVNDSNEAVKPLLSFHIIFMCILHLANEKVFKIIPNTEDEVCDDFTIVL